MPQYTIFEVSYGLIKIYDLLNIIKMISNGNESLNSISNLTYINQAESINRSRLKMSDLFNKQGAKDEISREINYKMGLNSKNFESIVCSLEHDKKLLREALADSIQKRDELYKAAIDYKNTRDELFLKNEFLESKLKELNNMQKEFNEMAHTLQIKNNEIKDLKERNLILESRIEESNFSQTPISFYKNVNPNCDSLFFQENSHSFSPESISLALKIQRDIKLIPYLHQLFDESFSSTNNFMDLIKDSKLEEVLLKLMKFIDRFLEAEHNRISSLQAKTSNHQKKRTPTFSSYSSPKNENLTTSPGSSEARNSPVRLSISEGSDNNFDFDHFVQSLSGHSSRVDQLSLQIQDTLSTTRYALSQSFRVASPRSDSEYMQKSIERMKLTGSLSNFNKKIEIETVNKPTRCDTERSVANSKPKPHPTIKVVRAQKKVSVNNKTGEK
ncbi:unnamed protein product [Blepharisma stoltei]|uniref:Uncharacterized protein n=1 Tax=Blepharisma stoltei TaxID=1481888 RepID=A0AAU9JS32_9CILI|nr:unnamed protein product [Blepharisma stoltei]